MAYNKFKPGFKPVPRWNDEEWLPCVEFQPSWFTHRPTCFTYLCLAASNHEVAGVWFPFCPLSFSVFWCRALGQQKAGSGQASQQSWASFLPCPLWKGRVDGLGTPLMSTKSQEEQSPHSPRLFTLANYFFLSA